MPELFEAFRLVEELSFVSAIGQFRDRVEQAQDRLLDHVASRMPETADAVAAHPLPGHPVHRAARTLLGWLAHYADGSGPGQELVARARRDFADAAAVPDATVAGGEEAAAAAESLALPGFPRQITDLEAAAAWRAMSPLARQEAETAMDDLARAEGWLVKAAVEAASWVEGRPRDAERATAFGTLTPAQQRQEARHARNAETDARDNVSYFRQRLEELNCRHAVLMHASILADAEAAATTAKRQAVIAASDAFETTGETAPQPRTAGERIALEEGFMARVTAAEEGIDQVLDVQRQWTSDARHRLYPQTAGTWTMRNLRTLLVDNGPIGERGTEEAYQAARRAERTLRDREERLNSGYVDFGSPAVTKEQVDQARKELQRTQQYLQDIMSSSPLTLRALKALDSVAGLRPSQSANGIAGVAERAAQVAADSRSRTRSADAEPRSAGAATQQLQHALYAPQQPGSGIRRA
ncbi:hypothetical protein [Streptomyces sp. CA-106110]|uniref:hypothetical protein n=1 Tax=Streptomyces sp. CA-106110 TaxID=3240044 RepID=UPI003D915933